MKTEVEIIENREWRVKDWAALIRRGVSGEGPFGSESSGEHFIVEAAGTCLPSGEPVLMLLHRFSIEELKDLQAAIDLVGIRCWRDGLKQRLAAETPDPGSAGVERGMVLALLAGAATPETLCGSTSQIIAAFLAVGRFESLPAPYEQKVDAWDRLNAAQQTLVKEFNPYFREREWKRPARYA